MEQDYCMVDQERSFMHSKSALGRLFKSSWSSSNKIDQDEYIDMKQATARISAHFVAVSANRHEFSSNECAPLFHPKSLP